MPKTAQRELPTKRAIRASIRRIRRRPRAEMVNESLAREYFARQVALPIAKEVWGDRLKASLITGSSQTGVRLASRYKHRPSDVDLKFIVDADSLLEGEKHSMQKSLQRRIDERLPFAIGFSVDVDHTTPMAFAALEPLRNEPFQVLHGERFLQSLLGDELMGVRKKRKMPRKFKYYW